MSHIQPISIWSTIRNAVNKLQGYCNPLEFSARNPICGLNTHSFNARKLTGILALVVLTAGSIFFQSEPVRAQSDNRFDYVAWTDSINGSWKIDGSVDPYPTGRGVYYYYGVSDSVKAEWTINWQNKTNLAHQGNDRFGTDSDFAKLNVGPKLARGACGGRRETNLPRCRRVEVIPNTEKLDKDLIPGQTLRVRLVIPRHGKSTLVLTATFVKEIEAPANWEAPIVTDSEGHADLRIERTAAFPDQKATLRVYKPDPSWFGIDSITEHLNPPDSEKRGDNGRVTDDVLIPSNYDRSKTFTYGSGKHWSGGELKYGFWIFDEKNGLLLFRPDNEGLNTLDPGDVVDSVLALDIRNSGGLLKKNHYRVRIRKEGVGLYWPDENSGSIVDDGRDSYEAFSGNTRIELPLTGTYTPTVSARDSSMSAADQNIVSISSTEPEFGREVITKYGKWLWKTDDTGFRFEPAAMAINQLDTGENASSTLHVQFETANGNTLNMATISVSITGYSDPTPTVTISSVAGSADGTQGTGITAGHEFEYTLTRPGSPDTPLPVSIILTQLGGDQRPILQLTPVTYEVSIPAGESTWVFSRETDSQNSFETLGIRYYKVEIDPTKSTIYTVGTEGSFIFAVKGNGTSAVSASNPRASITAETAAPHRVGTTAAFTVTITDGTDNIAPSQPIVVNYKVSSSDFLDSSFSLTGSVMLSTAEGADINIPLVDPNESMDNPDGSITVTLLDGTGYVLPNSPQHQVTISVTEDNAELSISGSNTVVEGNTGDTVEVTFTVSLSVVLKGNVTFNRSIEDGTATEPSDYIDWPTTTSRISSGQSSITFNVEIVPDNNNESDETFTVTISNQQSSSTDDGTVTLGTSSITVTILDDDSAVAVPEFVLNNDTVVEDAGTYNFPVNLSDFTFKLVTIEYELLSRGSATKGTEAANGDFMLSGNTDSGSLTIAKGTKGTTLPITIFDDADREGVETIIIIFDNPTNANLPNFATAKEITITIQDNDGMPTIVVDTSPLQEGDSNPMITVRLVPPATTDDISVDYVVSSGISGTATEGTEGDFIRATGTLMFDNDDSTTNIRSDSAEIPLIINDDLNYEHAETIEVTLSNLSGTDVQFSGGQTTLTNTIIINEDPDELKPSLSVQAVIEVWENAPDGTISIPVTLTGTTREIIIVEVETSSSVGHTAVAGTDYNTHSNTIATIPSGNLRYDIELPRTIIDNQISDGDKTFKVSLKNSVNTLNTLTTTPLESTVTIKDNEGLVPVITVTAINESVLEGEDIEITLEASPFPTIDLDVNLRVTQNGDYLFKPEKTVEFKSGRGTVSLKLNTISNSNTSGNGMVRVAVADGVGYLSGTPLSVEVRKPESGTAQSPKYSVVSSVISAILREIPPTPRGESDTAKPTLSVNAVNGVLEEGDPAVFIISSTHAVEHGFAIRIKLSQSGDFVIGSMDRTVDLEAEQLETKLIVDTDDDQLAELDGRITATIQVGEGYQVGSKSTARVTVSDSMDRQIREENVSGSLHAVLPDLLGRLTTRTMDITMERATHAFSGSSATLIELNGKSTVETILQSGGDMLNNNSPDWQSIIDDSSFTLGLYPEGGETNSATVWGVGDRWSLSNDAIGRHEAWSGETYTGHFGFDAIAGKGILTGLSMSLSKSKIEYGKTDASGFIIENSSTGLHPYLGYSSPNGYTQMQILTGYGVNELVLKQKEYSPELLNGNYHLVGLGGSNRLYSSDYLAGLHNLEISLAGQAWHSQQFVGSVEGLATNLQVEASHINIAVKGAQQLVVETGIITPSIAFGLRGDGRNEEAVLGANVAGEIAYEAYNGFQVAGFGSTMLSGLNNLHKWEVQSSLDYDFNNDDKGVLFNMASTWSGYDSDANRFIWESEMPHASNYSTATSNGRNIKAEIGYGFEILENSAVMTPYSAFNQTKANGNEFQIGSRLKTDSGLELELQSVRGESDAETFNHEYNLFGSINW